LGEIILDKANHGGSLTRRRRGAAKQLHVDVGPQLAGIRIGNAHGGFVGAGAVPDHNRRAIGIGILFRTVQAFEAIGLWIEHAEQAIERAVLQHQHDDVVDLLQ
jgi:hypothetical protein